MALWVWWSVVSDTSGLEVLEVVVSGLSGAGTGAVAV